MGTLFVDKLDPQSGTSLEIGSSGDTITIPSGATITNSGTATGFGETNAPSFYAYGASNQSISTATYTLAQQNTENWDTNSAYNNSTYTFTVPSGQGGKYAFYFGGEMEAIGANNVYYRSKLYKNGTYLPNSEQAGQIIFGGASNNQDYANSSFALNLSAGDTIQHYVFQNSGGSKNLYTGFFFGGFKIAS